MTCVSASAVRLCRRARLMRYGGGGDRRIARGNKGQRVQGSTVDDRSLAETTTHSSATSDGQNHVHRDNGTVPSATVWGPC